MTRLRLALRKGESLRFLSHLDYAQAVMRMIRRADLPMMYSEGFNPHMKISFSSALALGITADAEYADLELSEDIAVAEVAQRLNAVAPPGLEVTAGRVMPDKVRKMMAICNYAVYEVTGHVTADADWDALLQPINESEQIDFEKVTPKKTRVINIKEFVYNPLTAQKNDDGTVTITMGIGIYPSGTMKPGELWLFGRDRYNWPVTESYKVHRKGIYVVEDGVTKTPLECE